MGVAETPVVASSVQVEVEGADDVRSLTGEERDGFLDWVRAHRDDPEFSVNKACKAVGVRRRDVRALRERDPEFDEDYCTARGYGAEQIIGQMVKLAIEGVDEPIASGGEIVGTKRVYSERLLQTMFNGLTPEGKSMLAGKLGLEISGPGGGPIKVQKGVSLDDVARAFAESGVNLGQLAAKLAVPAEIDAADADIVDVVDEPA